MLNLDTHVLIHALSGELKPREKLLLERSSWGISAIVLWEITKLSQLGRISLDINDSDFVTAISNLTIWPITLDVCRKIRTLDFRADPADEIICATSLVYNVPLLTRDKVILASDVVPFPRK